jgi:diguanylate cyclase (GGDEF)-like protein
MSIATRESPQEAHSRLRQGVRGRAFNVLLHCFADSVGADTAILVARPETSQRTRLLATWTREGREHTVSWTSGSVLGRVLGGEGTLVEPAGEGDGPDRGEHRAVAAPVSTHTHVIGAICAGFEPPSGQSREELAWAADAYGHLASLCMSRDVTVAAALDAASFDPLTGCLSYGALVEVLKAETQRSRRRGHRLSVCMIDLDGFKRVNDERGHIEGNRVLSAVGGALRSAARSYDAVGRFGGDEFAIVLPETGGRSGERIAQRFRTSVESAIAEETPIPITASIGIVEWDGEASPLGLLDMADHMMRQAKGLGGARVQSKGNGHLDGLVDLSKQLARPLRGAGGDRQDGAGETVRSS